MKQTLLILTAALTFSFVAKSVAQDNPNPFRFPVREKPDKVVVKADPLELLNKAIAKAKESNKLVLLVVEPPNMDTAKWGSTQKGFRASRGNASLLIRHLILNDKKFKSFASDNLVSLTVASQSPIAEKFNMIHPQLALLNAKGETLRTDSTAYKWVTEGKAPAIVELTDMNVNGLIKDYTKHLPKVVDKNAK